MRVLAQHGHALEDLPPLGWVVAVLAALAVAWVIWRAVVLTVRPGEDAPDHLKRTVLDEEGESGPGCGAGRPSGGPDPERG